MSENAGITIIVNAKECVVYEKKVSYADVVKLAHGLDTVKKDYRMTYFNVANNKDINMTPGKTVKIHNGDVFNVV